jgi:hypothetical protein
VHQELPQLVRPNPDLPLALIAGRRFTTPLAQMMGAEHFLSDRIATPLAKRCGLFRELTATNAISTYQACCPFLKV